MKKIYKYILWGNLLFLLPACQKNDVLPEENMTATGSSFIQYVIRQGQHYSDQSTFTNVQYDELKFAAIFDSTAVYRTADPANQEDINKLYGFSDSNSPHHQFSARFGWNWSRDSLRLFAYTYNNAVRESKEIGTVQIGAVNNCSIKVTQSTYIFTLNGKPVTTSRSATGTKAVGYRLYPYFGGDETAPHTINIWIKEN